MTSFGWKRKLGEKILKEKVQKFTSDSKDENDDDEEVDWLSLAPKKKALLIEDSHAKSERLKKEGIVLAEAERFWEAIGKWNEAIQLTPGSETLLEMKAQALMAVGEVLPALQAAQKVVELAPVWWVAHQTLGRALINIGEVTMALKSFSRAIHLNPSESELWSEDLIWTQSLIAGKKVASTSVEITETSNKKTISIKELPNECSEGEERKITNCDQLMTYNNVVYVDSKSEESTLEVEASLVQIPANYVHMRDPT